MKVLVSDKENSITICWIPQDQLYFLSIRDIGVLLTEKELQELNRLLQEGKKAKEELKND